MRYKGEESDAFGAMPTGALKTSPVFASSITAASLNQTPHGRREEMRTRQGRREKRREEEEKPGALVDSSLGIQLRGFQRASNGEDVSESGN
jgi:hypothetical protein